jgi:ABC-type nitrate/sulfonate/bicarbonate transport system substrate-binding protein
MFSVNGFGRRELPATIAWVLVALLVLSGCGRSETGTDREPAGPASAPTAAGTTPGSNTGGDAPRPTAGNQANGGDVPTVEMVIFSPPSLGAFLPVIIEERQLDIKHGIDLKFTERPPTAYNTEFATGQFKVGGSAALLSEALRSTRGVKVCYLFNLFDYWGTVITANDDIKTLKDLEGATMAAANSTTNYAMFQYFAQKAGVDVSKIEVLNAATPALVTYAEANRADAVQLWEPAYSTLVHKAPDRYRQLDLGLNRWTEYTGSENIPYLGVAVHQDWAQENQELLPKMYKVYAEATEWVSSNPEEAAKIVAEKIPGGDPAPIRALIQNNDRLQMGIAPASTIAEDIRAVFQAGVDSGYFKTMPDESAICQAQLE